MRLGIIKRTLSAVGAILASAALSAASFAEDAPYVPVIFNERNGLPTGEANDVLQTSDGYVWVGSYGGLIRYDGTNFRNFSTEGILPSSSVRMMFEDSAGRLWIGTNDAGVFVYEDHEITRPPGQPSDTFLCVRGFAEDSKGVIYACSNSGVAEIRGGVMNVYDIPELAGLTVYSLAADRFGRVWCADSTGGCKAIKNGKMVASFEGADIFGDDSVYSVTSNGNGGLWLGSSGTEFAEVEFLSEGDAQSDRYVSIYYGFGSVSTHNSLRMTKNGELIISGQHGLGVFGSDRSFREFTSAEGADSVNSACIDYEGNIWLASSGKGIVRFSKGSYSSPNNEAGLGGVTINAIAVSDGISYIGTDSGLLIRGKDWQSIENDLTALYCGERKIRIRDVISDSRGNIWIAAYDIPVVRYDPKSGDIRVFTADDGLVSGRARVLLELSDGRTAVGTQGGVSIISGDRVETSYSDLAYPSTLSLLELEDGTLLAGSDGGGIYELKNGAVVEHSFSEGLSEGVVLRMLRDEAGGGFFISAGSSLYYWKDGAFTKLSALEKGPGSIFDFYLDGNTLWLLQNNGILAADREDLLAGGTGEPEIYGFAHGLSGSLNANTRHCLYDGKLYLSTRNGVSVFNFSKLENVLPKGIINSVTIDGEVYEHPERLDIPSGAQRVTIDFAALTFTDTTPVSIAYRLEGFDDGETVLRGTKSGSVSYTNLRGGSYTFRMRIFCAGSDEENTVTLAAVKEKRITELPLFWAGMVVLLILTAVLIVALIARTRINRARKRQREYRDILEQSLLTFAGTIDAKDAYTNGHSTRVAKYSRELARRMGLSPEQQEHIYYVALLHDIGKIGIPDNILNKPGKLTPEERKIIQTHPDIGAEILKNFTALEGISDGAKYHHERFDGKGYSEGRSGHRIPLVARIICVADTYDAMSSERCYRKPLSGEVIESELREGSGTQFDPEIVPYMMQMIEEGIVPYKD